MNTSYDAIIIGSGPNGLAAAVKLQQQGLKTLILEKSTTPGGATQTLPLTLPGFLHDIGSAIHPLTHDSPFLSTLPLQEHGLQWIYPEIAFAHPFTDGSAIACYKDIDDTASQLGMDEYAYKKIFNDLNQNWPIIKKTILGPLRIPLNLPKTVNFGLYALMSASYFVNNYFKEEKTRAFFYGAAAHSTLPLTSLASASFGLVLCILAHQTGWPFPKGGAGKITEAMLSYYKSIGGEIELGYEVLDLSKIPNARSYVLDLTPKQILALQGTDFSSLYRKRLASYRYGPGIFKIDWALNKPIPFLNEKCTKAGTIHLGFTTAEMEASEKAIHQGHIFEKPYVLLAQHSQFDQSRAPDGMHTAWAYCHVPNGNTEDMTIPIEGQIEKIAPGFRSTILQRSTHYTQQLESFNPNLVGGDINGGKQDLSQLFFRPMMRITPYATADPRVYICSSSTPPGGGVHGMCGYHAALSVLRDHF